MCRTVRRYALCDCVLDEVTAYVFHGVQPKTDLSVIICGKAAVGDVHIRRQHLDAQTGALAGILDDLIGIIQHAGEQCCHELAGVMALEISRLECHISVAGRMALVESVGRKAGHFVVDLVCYLLRDAVGNTARAFVAGLGAAVHKMFPLGFHDGVLLFAHGAADVICLSEGEACQFPEDLHDLLLISLYRPGPMDSIPTYLRNRHEPDKISYKTPQLAHILDVTNGCIVYQEQVMQIFRELAGFSFGQADRWEWSPWGPGGID